MTPPTNHFACSRSDATPIGLIEVMGSSAGLYQVNLLGHAPAEFPTNHNDLSESDLTRLALQQIMEYLAGKRCVFDLPVDWSICRPFQRAALSKAMDIPFGSVLTYGELAIRMGNPRASRAIGGAMAHNPIPLVIPCHRVVAADGRLTGYSAAEGIHTKQWLLELEGHKIVREKLA
jgi:methylated-DNA-[protein]-cysteine S-methyltransferase